MISYLNKLKLLRLSRNIKKTLVILLDIILCFFSVWISFYVITNEFYISPDIYLSFSLLSIILAFSIYWFFDLYNTFFRYTNLSINLKLFKLNFLYGLIYFLVIFFYEIKGAPKNFIIIQPIFLFVFIFISRLFITLLFSKFLNIKKKFYKQNVLIYGAGDAGRQLLAALENAKNFSVVGFLDDNINFHKQYLYGKTIYSVLDLKKILKTKRVDQVFLAIPSLGRKNKNKIIDKLNKYSLNVKTLPSLSELADGKITLSDIKEFNVNDLLNRDEIIPDIDLLNKNINSQTVIVTGAGGSIGSELCRQIIRLKPKKLLLFELNEFALYKIYEELKSINKNLKILPIIGNVQDQIKLEIILEKFKVDTVYHSAAYKHVSIVENNICEGIKNNVIGTLSITKASIKKNVKNFVLISTDKAVKPTNIMGASKRLAELCVQGLKNSNKDKLTNFSIVRFGNVINSSGSAIPKFKEQIKQGGPITLTHLEVTRYFMTIFEAAQLVIQAGALGKNAEVFILDMGESVKIIDLVYRMVTFSGLTIKDKNNIDGDIEIKNIGLRPGEKLHEELLLGNNPEVTIHPKIQKIDEPFIIFEKLEKELDKLNKFLANEDSKNVKEIITSIVSSYNSNAELVDIMFVKEED